MPQTDKLQDLLSQQVELFLNAQMAHWNVTGPCFTELHGLFRDVYEMAHGHFDSTAEYVRQTQSKVSPPDVSVQVLTETVDMIPSLLSEIEAMIAWMNSALVKDLDLAGQTLFGDQLVDLNKMAWKLRSHLDMGGTPVTGRKAGYAYKQ